MLFKLFPVFLTLLGSICANYAANETIATKTNTIVKPELLSTVNEMFANNPPQQTAGIEVVIVYECGGPQQPQQPLAVSPVSTFVTTSKIAYTVSTQITNTQLSTICQNDKCEVSTIRQVVPSTFKSTAQVTYTTTGTTKVTSGGDPANPANTSDPNDGSDPIDSTTSSKSNAGIVTIPTGKTTTSTLFHASQPQNSTYSVPTSKQTITTTERNPVSTNAPVSSSVPVTINTASFTKSLTLSAAANSTYTIATSGSSKTAYFNATMSGASKSNENQSSSSQASAAQVGGNVANETYSSATLISTSSSGSSAPEITPISSQYTTVEVTKNSTLVSFTQYSNNSQSSYPVTYVASELVNVTVPVSVSSTLLSPESSTLSGSSSVVFLSIESSSSTELTSLSSSITGSSSVVSSSSSSSSSSSGPIMNTPNVNVIVSSNSNNYNGDAFDVISTENPPTVFSRQELPLAIPDGVDNNGSPIQTNKFYANLFLGDQTDMIWSWPYGMKWSNENYYGFGIQHTNVSDRQFGSQDTNNFGVPSYYFNPVGTSEIIFSSPSLSSTNNHLSVSDMESMSVNVKLAPSSTLGSDYIELPIVQGMGFVTAIYHGDMVPLLNSLIGIQTFTKETSTVLNSRTLKYRATLFNGVEWLIYVSLPNSSTSFELDVKNPFNIEGSSAIDGVIIQVAVAPETSNLQKRDGASMEGYYDQSCGQYVTNADIVGTISSGVAAQYGFQYSTEGSSSCGSPIVFALPHHVESLTASTSQFATGIRLASTTKGNMYAYLTDKLMMSETLETDVQFLPWSKQMSKSLTYSPEQLVLLAKTANEELQVDIASSVASMDSNYFSGKVLDKYAYILLVVHEIIQDEAVTKATLEQMKTAFDLFINNKQYFPLMYDTKFGGVTSTSAQGGDTGADFGSAYYNDHHFHYGYFVHAAAIVGKVDKDLGGNWAETNKDWVNSLVRDVANPSKSDPHFPVYRMFDWFAGHSWAAGLFASGDGKNQESSSEDYNFAYGMKLWGKVIGNDAMESRGDLMLAVMSRAMNKYILYSDDNDVEPSTILPNKVAGIIFENKITYTTYFGSPNVHPEYVHGIHMLPITPASSLIRNPTFVQQEWNEQVETFIDNVDSGWTGILKLNQALYDPDASYDFFSSSSWSSSCLDNGQSRTWSLAYAGGVSNSV